MPSTAVGTAWRMMLRTRRSASWAFFGCAAMYSSTDLKSVLAIVVSALGGPALVDRLRRVGCDLKLGAVVIRVSARIVERVLGHELHDLQGALPARNVRQLDIGLERRHLAGGSRRVDEEAIGDHRYLRRLLDFR